MKARFGISLRAYGRFYRSRLLYFLRRLNDQLVRWACRKYDKRLRNRERRAMELLAGAARRSPWLFRTGGSAHVLTAGQWEPASVQQCTGAARLMAGVLAGG